jgi:predicted RecB family nuclease
MSKIITSEIFLAYFHCRHKAYLLLCTREKGTPHEYVRILEQQRQVTQRKHLNIFRRKNIGAQSYSIDNLKGKYEFLVNATLETTELAAECAILSKVRTHSGLGRYSYEPTIFVSTHSINKEQKLELFFVSHVLEQLQNKRPVSGRIIGLDEKPHRVKIENNPKILIPLLEPIAKWAEDVTSFEPPPLILNKHCSTCQFYDLCRAKAKQVDNLSLLDRISTQKVINKYEKKGLFTVNQLSYTFKPRKRKKRTKNSPSVTHKPELQALAIRTGKIYLQELPQLTRQPVELFLDIEGVPDRQFYYLVGLLVCEKDTSLYHSFWADTPEDETQMWQQVLAKIGQYPDAPIYHYGSYEPRTLTTLAKRHNTGSDSFANRLINVNKFIYGKVYFPIYSNRLKEIGHFIGVTWTSPDASGLKSLVWRHHWDKTHNIEYKILLLTYNQEDCQALKLLTDELSRLKHSADTLSEVDFAAQPKLQATEIEVEIHNQFEAILKSTHFDYDKKKIIFWSNENGKSDEKKKRGAQKGHPQYRRKISKAGKIVCVPRRRKCPTHKGEPLQASEEMSERTIIDLVFTKSGIRKTITKYIGTKGYCQKCHSCYTPHGINKLGNQVFGHSFQSWVIYQRLFLRLPYRIITQVLKDQFNERISVGTIVNFLKYFTDFYSDTEQILIQRIQTSPFVHVDETKISIQGIEQYVWVFTDENHVILKLTETREAAIVHEILSNYQGVLISDFYPGYDSAECKQQKCWGHLIRDINDDLWAAPFDTEFEMFVLEVRNLIIPIMEAVQKYGLKKRNLTKFKKSVDKFYKKVIVNKRYKSELNIKYQKRFEKYRDSLFIFLEQDGIPWHNNTAERALRHLAVQRKISGSFFESVTHHYLLLLGIMQSCRFQDKSFLKFLLSGDTDIDQFKKSKRR